MPAAAIQGYHFSTSAVPQLVPTYLISDAKVTFSQNSVRLNPDENINIQVQFTQPLSNETHLIYGGYLKVSSSDMNTNATHESHIPYFGALGNQRDLPILDTKTGYPFIGDSNGHILNTSLVYNFATTKRHWQPSSVLHLYTRLGSPTAIIKFELVSEQDQVIGQLWDGQSHYVSRNDHSNDLYDYALDWSGRILDNRNKSNVAPNGSFRIRAKALKIFGHPDRIDDWETWLSPSFRINRI
ncbi:hypothetical protein CU098_005965 [Rhizopus stolonifer]|uniref:Uncharacterized protein n=2 Tax=Mucorineae TaxID=1344963 RepID=A0A367KMG8_RHIST|nr:hypothetical protein CU098_005965 [Rhizopus stolonifer]